LSKSDLSKFIIFFLRKNPGLLMTRNGRESYSECLRNITEEWASDSVEVKFKDGSKQIIDISGVVKLKNINSKGIKI